MATPINLDLSRLQDLEAPGILKRFSLDIYDLLSSLPEIQNRAEGCLMFLHSTVDERSRPFLRAALSECCSMLEIAGDSIDFKKDPRIQIVRLLRHANVHLIGSDLRVQSRPAEVTINGETKSFDYAFLIIPNLSDCIKSTRESKRYTASDLDVTITWLERQQSEWGICNTIQKICELCVREISKVTPTKH